MGGEIVGDYVDFFAARLVDVVPTTGIVVSRMRNPLESVSSGKGRMRLARGSASLLIESCASQ